MGFQALNEGCGTSPLLNHRANLNSRSQPVREDHQGDHRKACSARDAVKLAPTTCPRPLIA